MTESIQLGELTIEVTRKAVKNVHLHQIAGDWSAWKEAMLALPGEFYAPPVKAAAVTSTMTRQELPGEVEAEEHPGQRKGKKLRVAKPSEGVEHAHPA